MLDEQIGISERIIKFCGRIIKLVNVISETSAGKKVADQLVRCGTSIGANYEEAHGAQSRADFAHKMQIALKESRETRYWLCVVMEADLAPGFGVEALIDEATQLRAILGKSVATIRGTAKSPLRVLPKSSPPQDKRMT
jgi:four helix bundle protein